jgi:hypothetical protein
LDAAKGTSVIGWFYKCSPEAQKTGARLNLGKEAADTRIIQDWGLSGGICGLDKAHVFFQCSDRIME